MAANISMKLPLIAAVCLIGASLAVPFEFAEAARGGGNARAGAQTSVNRPAANTNRGGGSARANTSSSGGRNVNRNTNVNQNVNVNVNNNGNRDWDNDCCDNDWDDNPLARAAVVTGTIAAIGSIVRQPPANCVPVSHQNITYQQCGSTWYQPQYSGSNVQYMVVSPPY
ncbi:hypothetical protein [Arenimonas daejeonensis]|uniref:hypothetical protein n=1 Tax=Arenimonas daejeonensis TaxID=370777 RepID=UPI001D1331F1|nr:hypothetical protein [Arenimonas daejeonensis]